MLLNSEEKFFLKICLLLTLSLKAVRKVFDDEISPDLLKATLTSNFVRLRKLKTKGIISTVQWNILFPNQEGSPCSSSFDTTLMIILLRHIAEIEVSDKLPVKLDCRGAYLGTIKYYRNLLGHSITNTLTRETYASAWSHLTEAIRKLTTSNFFNEEIRRVEEIRCVEEIRRVEEMDIDLVNSDTESEIKSSFLEIKRLRAAYMMLEEDLKKMKSILSDPVPFNIRSQFTTQLRSWQEDDQMYVKTSWSEQILNLLQQSKMAAIIGGTGCGKTTLMHHVALQMTDIGYDVIPITFSYDIIEFYDATRKTLFVIDNFCGKYSLDPQIHDMWVQVFKHIADISLIDNFKIVLACRLQVFWDIRFNFKSMFENCSVNLHESTLTWTEKLEIAQKYNLTIESKNDHTKTILQSCYCFPLLCALNEHHHDSVDIFMYPYHVLENELEIMFLNCEDGKFCAIVLLVIFNNELPRTCLTNSVTPENKVLLEKTLKACNLKTYHKIKDDIHSLMQSFVLEIDGVYHALDSKMFDFLAHFVADKMMPCLIRSAVPELISKRFMIVNPRAGVESFKVPIDNESYWLNSFSAWDKLGKYVIIIPPELELDYYERMIYDWSRGYACSVLSNGNFVYRPFFTYLNQLNSNELYNLVNKEDVVDKSTPIISYVRMSQNMFPHIGWLVSRGADINHCNKYNMTALYYACSLDRFDVVEVLLNKQADLNKCDKDGCSPLHIACANGFENIVEKLLDFKANINLRNKVGNSPLHIACNNKHKTIVEILLKRNADSNLTNNEGVSPIELAQRSEDNILLLLLQNNENLLKPRMQGFSKEVDEQIRNDVDVNNFDTFGRSHLFLASNRGNTDIVKSLLKKNAEVNTCNKNGVSPLMIASSSGFLTIVKDLLENGAECDQTDNAGQSPLVFALKNGHLDIMVELLINEANVNIRDEEGNTPLINACKYSNIFAVKKLLLFNSNINECNDNGISPLFMACDVGNVHIFKILANSGASIPRCLLVAVKKGRLDIVCKLPKNEKVVNHTDKELETPLLVACRHGRLDIATELMKNNANVNHCNEKGETPLLASCSYPHRNLAYRLLRNGARVNRANYKGQTPLHVSITHRSRELVFLLLIFNAKVNKTDDNGETPLSLAKLNGDINISTLLNRKKKTF